MKPDTGFSRAIRNLRRERGLTQPEFSELLGMKKNSISWYETGRALPTVVILERIVKFANKDGKKYTYNDLLGLDLDDESTLSQYDV
jgi:transcriptional regulator with XRE-family HTH domain